MTKEKVEVIKTKQETWKGPFIYCGPNIGMKLPSFTILIGENPKIIDQELKECESISKLIVPVEKLSDTKISLKIEGSRENIFYKDILKYLEGSDK